MTNYATDALYIFQNQTTNTTSQTFYLDFTGKSASLIAYGTWDGASMYFQIATPPTITGTPVWVTVRNLSRASLIITDDEPISLAEYVIGRPFRGVIINSGASTSLNCIIQVI
jgi:hypothetical protein